MAVLPSQRIRDAIERRIIQAAEPIGEPQIQPASLDLRLGVRGYELRASFIPGAEYSIEARISHARLALRELDLTTPITLRPGNVYLIELLEHLNLPPDIKARANPRSTTGRADLFARLLCDYSSEFEGVPAGYQGKLYVELVPRTFSIRLQKGTRINQLRFIHGLDSEEDLPVRRQQSLLSVDLTPEAGTRIIGYRARRNAPVLDFDGIACHDRFDYWDPIVMGELRSLVLNPDDFYILRSRERVQLDPVTAAELMPYESSFGEFRVHYAGFLDPGFGYTGGAHGTPVGLEVRARDVPFLVEDGQVMGVVVYFGLEERADKLYGAQIGSAYQRQGIALGKQFRPLTQAE